MKQHDTHEDNPGSMMFRHWQLGMQSKREAYASLEANFASSPTADMSAAFAFFCVMLKR